MAMRSADAAVNGLLMLAYKFIGVPFGL